MRATTGTGPSDRNTLSDQPSLAPRSSDGSQSSSHSGFTLATGPARKQQSAAMPRSKSRNIETATSLRRQRSQPTRNSRQRDVKKRPQSRRASRDADERGRGPVAQPNHRRAPASPQQPAIPPTAQRLCARVGRTPKRGGNEAALVALLRGQFAQRLPVQLRVHVSTGSHEATAQRRSALTPSTVEHDTLLAHAALCELGRRDGTRALHGPSPSRSAASWPASRRLQ